MKKSTLKKVLKGYLLFSFVITVLQLIAYIPIFKRIKMKLADDDNDVITSKSGVKYVQMHNNLLIKTLGYKFAAVLNFAGWLFIITDNAFDRLSDNCKDVIISHEIGHIEHMHLNNTIESYKAMFGRIVGAEFAIAKEYEADQYAVSVYGYDKTIDALTEMSHLLKGIGKKEITKRIDHLKVLSLVEENMKYKEAFESLVSNHQQSVMDSQHGFDPLYRLNPFNPQMIFHPAKPGVRSL